MLMCMCDFSYNLDISIIFRIDRKVKVRFVYHTYLSEDRLLRPYDSVTPLLNLTAKKRTNRNLTL